MTDDSTCEKSNRVSARQYTRRDIVGALTLGPLGAVLQSCDSCDVSSDRRRFYAREVFRWRPQELLTELAFAIVPLRGDAALDYLDLRSPLGTVGFRVFSYAVELGSEFVVACPTCPPAVRLSVAVSRVFIKHLRSYAMRRAVAFLRGGGFDVHGVGPLRTRYGTMAVSRSSACYSIYDREPQHVFNREIPAVPDRLNYFTEVVGGNELGGVYHVWRRDGEVTDRIPLDVGSSKWRTWSRKEHLAPGAWIVTTETARGAILDSREFHIAA